MGIVTNRTASRRLVQNWDAWSARTTRVLLTAVILVLLCSSCGHTGSSGKSSGNGNANVPAPAMSPSPSTSPPVGANNPDVPGPTMTAPPSPSGTVYAPQGEVAKVFAEPSLDSAVVTTLDSGTVVEILCTTQGDTVSNEASGATSSLWDKTQAGYIPDVIVDTGTTQPVAPSCS